MAGDDVLVTVLAPRLTEDIDAQVEALITRFGLHRERRQPLAEVQQGDHLDCVEYQLSAAPTDLTDVRHAALALSETLGVDIVVQRNQRSDVVPRLICFDMDSTLIKAEVIDALAHRHGVGADVAEVTERAMRGELDFQASFRERMSKLAGLDASVLASIAAELPLMDGVERLMKNLNHFGYRTAILSGGFTYFAHDLQERLGFDEVHANTLLIDQGKVTGEVKEPIVDAERKALLLEQIAQREGITLAQTIAVGDGANDLKMLAKAGMGVAFRAKPVVREQARQALSVSGIDGVLYLMGYRASDLIS